MTTLAEFLLGPIFLVYKGRVERISHEEADQFRSGALPERWAFLSEEDKEAFCSGAITKSLDEAMFLTSSSQEKAELMLAVGCKEGDEISDEELFKKVYDLLVDRRSRVSQR